MSLAGLGPSQEEVRECEGEREKAGKFSNPWGSGNSQSRPWWNIPVIPAFGSTRIPASLRIQPPSCSSSTPAPTLHFPPRTLHWWKRNSRDPANRCRLARSSGEAAPVSLLSAISEREREREREGGREGGREEQRQGGREREKKESSFTKREQQRQKHLLELLLTQSSLGIFWAQQLQNRRSKSSVSNL